MLARVLGTRDLDFKSREGELIQGKQIFVAYKDTSDNNTVHGEMVEKIFVSHDSGVLIPDFKFGNEYDFQYVSSGFGSRARSVLSAIVAKGV